MPICKNISPGDSVDLAIASEVREAVLAIRANKRHAVQPGDPGSRSAGLFSRIRFYLLPLSSRT